MSDPWHWDDEHIPDTEALYRHVPKEPKSQDGKKRLDPATLKWKLTTAAFTTAEMKEDGWSIYRDALMRENRITIEDIENSGDEPREAWIVAVGDVRAQPGCGVIDEIDEADEKLGIAHGLIRCNEPKPDKQKIVTLRNWLIARAEQVQ